MPGPGSRPRPDWAEPHDRALRGVAEAMLAPGSSKPALGRALRELLETWERAPAPGPRPSPEPG